MKRLTPRQRVALVVALAACLLTLCAVAHAAPLHLDRWTSLLGQHTGGSFGGSAWGSGGGGSSSSSSSGSGGSAGDGIIGAILGFLLELLFELLVQVFWYCLTHHPFPTVTTLAIGGLFLGASWRDAKPSDRAVPEAATTRGAEFAAGDEAVFRSLAETMSMTGVAGMILAGALALGGVAGAFLGATRSALLALSCVLVAGLGGVVGLAAQRLRTSAEALSRVYNTQGSDIDHVTLALRRVRPVIASLAIVLGVASAVLSVLVLAASVAGE